MQHPKIWLNNRQNNVQNQALSYINRVAVKHAEMAVSESFKFAARSCIYAASNRRMLVSLFSNNRQNVVCLPWRENVCQYTAEHR